MSTRYQFVDDSGETRLAGFLQPEPGGSNSYSSSYLVATFPDLLAQASGTSQNGAVLTKTAGAGTDISVDPMATDHILVATLGWYVFTTRYAIEGDVGAVDNAIVGLIQSAGTDPGALATAAFYTNVDLPFTTPPLLLSAGTVLTPVSAVGVTTAAAGAWSSYGGTVQIVRVA